MMTKMIMNMNMMFTKTKMMDLILIESHRDPTNLQAAAYVRLELNLLE